MGSLGLFHFLIVLVCFYFYFTLDCFFLYDIVLLFFSLSIPESSFNHFFWNFQSLLIFLLPCFLALYFASLRRRSILPFLGSVRIDRYRGRNRENNSCIFPYTHKKIFCRKRNQVLIKLLLALHSLNYYSGGAGNAVKEHDWKHFNSSYGLILHSLKQVFPQI